MSESNSKEAWNNGEESENKTDCNKAFADDFPSDHSQELFSDEEETNKIIESTPQQSLDDYSFLNSLKTPLLPSDVQEHSFGQPVIPKTPISLAPFIYKINEPWTSDLETPESKIRAKEISSTGETKILKSVERALNHQHTPILEKIKSEDVASVSHILNNNKKKKPKRQIFKTNMYENLEITSSFEDQLKAEESALNDEVVKNSEITSSPSSSPSNNLNISTHKENSSPKCLDKESNKLPEIEVQSLATSSPKKSLGDIVGEVKKFLEQEEKFEISEVDISENDMLKNTIQLERAAMKFPPAKEIPSTITELGLIPFSQYFKETDEESSNEASFNQEPKNISIEKDLSEEKVLGEKCEKENNSFSSPISKHVKIFTDTLQKKLPKENEDESDLFNLEFSQWLYNDDSQIIENKSQEDMEMTQVVSGHFENLNKDSENCQPSTEIKIEEKCEEKNDNLNNSIFPEIEGFDFEQDFQEEMKPEILKISDSKTITCGFSTARGTSIKINEEKLKRAQEMYKEIENNEKICELNTKIPKISQLPSSSKENIKIEEKLSKDEEKICELDEKKIPLSELSSSSEVNLFSDLKTNFTSGFATASGKNITVNQQKLLNAQKMYDEIKIATEKTFDKENHSTDVKRKILGENTNSKRFKPLLIGISRTSPVSNRNITVKNISEDENSEFKSAENVSCETISVEYNQCGFKTARGKNIVINEEKLLNAEKLFESIDGSDLIKAAIPKPSSRKSSTFPPCSEKTNIQFRNKSSQPSPSDLLDKPSRNKESLVTKPLVPDFNGFASSESTNSSALSQQFFNDFKKIEIVSQSFEEKMEKIFENVQVSDEGKNKENEEKKLSDSKVCVGFLTAGGRKISVDANMHMKANSLFKDENLLDSQFFKVDEKESKTETKISIGFSTAGGKKISVNADAHMKANSLFSEDNSLDLKTMETIFSKSSDDLTKKPICLTQNTVEEISKSKIQSKSRDRKVLWNTILKRKIDDVNNDTPLGRHDFSKSKKPKLNFDLHGKKLFSEEAISDDETEIKAGEKIDYLNKPGTSSSFDIGRKEIYDPDLSVLNSNSIINDTIASEDFFKPFSQETSNCSELKIKTEQKMDIEEDSFPEEVPRSPILGKSKIRKKRRSRMFHSMLSNSSLNNLKSESSIHNPEFWENRIAAAFELDKIISRKRKEKPRPIKGSFLNNRDEHKQSRISLRELANGSAPTLRSEQELKERGINPDVLNVSASTAEFYKFRIDNIDGSVQSNLASLKVGDGANLVFDKNGSVGIEEFETAFKASPGVNPSLLPRGWLRNHYRWIVWKLASMDRMKFGSSEVPRMLTPDRVMKDLKYRYDREIDRSQRSAIRKILEKDDVSSKRMILCIATITESLENETEDKDPRILSRTPRWKIEVTDGWYSIPVSFDTAMVKYIIDGKIREGTKIITSGAELLNCDQGCFPLEKMQNVCLKIHTNCTRRARWDAKLGYQFKSGPIASSLKAVDPNGGLIGQLCVVVSRIYPIMYREKTADGLSIYRNEKNEEKAIMEYERECQSKAEAIYIKAQKKFEVSKHDSSEEDSAESLINFDSFSKLSEAQRMKLLSNRQAREERLKMKINEEIKANLPPPRQVVPVQKIRVIDGETCAVLTIWSKSEDFSILKEGGCYSLFNISAYGKRDGELQLTASRQAIFKFESTSNQTYPCRKFTSLNEIPMPGFVPPYCELDTVGVVSWIGNTPNGMRNFEAICLAYPNEDSSSAYLLILFWQGISSYGFSNVLTMGSLIACSNLEVRKIRSSSSISLCYCSERTVFTQKPRQAHLLSAFEALNEKIPNTKVYAKNCGEEISASIQKRAPSRNSCQVIMSSADRNSINSSPHFMVAKTPNDVDTPVASSVNKKRIERLERYGQPPELSPIVFNNSRSVRSNFKPVLRTPISTNLTNHRPDTA